MANVVTVSCDLSEVRRAFDAPASRSVQLIAEYGITVRRDTASALTVLVFPDGTEAGFHNVVCRPGDEPTHNDAEGGKRWHYLNLAGEKLDPPAYLYAHVSGGWGGECDGFIFPDGHSPAGPATREHIQGRIEEKLHALGFQVLA